MIEKAAFEHSSAGREDMAWIVWLFLGRDLVVIAVATPDVVTIEMLMTCGCQTRFGSG